MGHLSTHVLDTMNGCPAFGMAVKLLKVENNRVALIKEFTLNADGRNEGGALLSSENMQIGLYRLVFSVAPYFRALGVILPHPAFIDEVQLDFGIADASGRYHVPLLVSPWAFSTYKGS